MAIRSGRFKVANAFGGITIVKGRDSALYRILNSGDNPFNIKTATLTAQPLKPTFSLDVIVRPEIVISTAAANQPIEGIYEFLAMEDRIRSGRFKLRQPDNDPTIKHPIIDLNVAGQKKKAYYRIFNSGDNPFKIYLGASLANNTDVYELQKNQSYDFEVGSGNERNVSVNSSAVDKPIEGIYEFLGLES